MVIQTFVFLDFEATGLPEKEQNRTKAIELTLLAVSRCDIINADGRNMPPLKKLSFRCNPQRKISLEAATLTGLTNDLLINEPIFKDKIKCINEFLDLPEPVCLVAHSGHKLDFKLLRAEYNDAGAKLPMISLSSSNLKPIDYTLIYWYLKPVYVKTIIMFIRRLLLASRNTVERSDK
ncbi:unnamed protein product, partial [Brenthis ino]